MPKLSATSSSRHSLEAGPLPAGLYYLDVLEERPRPGAGLDQLEGPAGEGGQPPNATRGDIQRNAAEHCHLFSLALSARAVPVGVPLIAQVVPAGARNLKVGEPLSLALHLSADFARPAAARGLSLLAALNAAGAATLLRLADGTLPLPLPLPSPLPLPLPLTLTLNLTLTLTLTRHGRRGRRAAAAPGGAARGGARRRRASAGVGGQPARAGRDVPPARAR